MCANSGPSNLSLDRPCSEDHLAIIAKDLTQWEMVAAILGLSEAEVEEVNLSYKSDELPLKRIKMLMKWKNKYKENATYQRLITAFSFLDRCDMAERVRELSTTPSRGGVHHSTPFAELLKTWYAYTDPDPDVWPPIDRRKFCKLEIGKIETAVSVNGTIVKKRVPIDFCNIFSSQTELRKETILIEGAPGCGKSRLLWYMCQMWAAGKMFQQFSLVIYIKLREYSTIQSPCSIADILPCSSDIKERAWREIMEVNGKGVLFLLDGWDELPQNLQINSIFKEIIKSSPKHSLLLSTVVVTSRYVSSDELHRLATSHLETLGFADQEVKECIMDITGNDKAAHALMEALESRPSLLSSCHLPLNAMIIAYVFQVKINNLPTTLLETFKLLVLNCILRHVIKRKPDREHEDITSLESLPKELQESFYSLCKMAFCGLLEHRMLFSQKELNSNSISDTLSLLYGTKLQEATGPRTMYSFLHQTVQELLAAMHLSRMPPEVQLKRFHEFIAKPMFHPFIQFYAGITSLKLNGIIGILHNTLSYHWARIDVEASAMIVYQHFRKAFVSNLMSPLDLSEETLEKFKTVDCKQLIPPDENGSAHAMGRAMLLSLVETSGKQFIEDDDAQSTTPSVGKEAQVIANCLYEANNPTLYELLDEKIQNLQIINVPLTPSDCLSLGCLIARSRIRCLDLVWCDLSSYCMESLKQGLGESPCISKLQIADSSLDEQTIQKLRDVIRINSNLNSLSLGFCTLKHKGLMCILNALKGFQMHSLSLCVSNVQVDDSNGPVLQDFIIGMPSLVALDLTWNPLIGDNGAYYIGQALKCNNSLRTLTLCGCGITGIVSLCEGLEKNTSLTDLDLNDNNICDDGIKRLSQSLASNHTLKTLQLQRCGFTEFGIKSLARMLFHNTTIATILWDENVKMTNEELMQMLKQCGLWTHSIAAILFHCTL